MVFSSDRQRKAFFANRGNIRSNVNPDMVKLNKFQQKTVRDLQKIGASKRSAVQFAKRFKTPKAVKKRISELG